MKNQIIRRMLTVMLLTLAAALLLFPLLLPSENYFRMLLRLLPAALLIGGIMLIPIFRIGDRMSANIRSTLRHINMESPEAVASYPELKPLARQIMGLKAQIAEQMDALTQQKEQLQVLTENMREGLILIDTKGRVLSANHAALRLLGTDKPLEEGVVYDYNDTPAFYDVVSSAAKGIHGETTLSVGDVVCQLIANPVMGDESINGAVLVLLDITEREKRDALRREFTSNVSHELKTPLTSIFGIADMIGSGLVKTEDITGFAKKIRDESSRMITLIEDIIRLSRLDDDSFTEEIVPLDLYEIAESVAEQLQPQADLKQITVSLDGDAAPMEGVPVIVEEMLFNLCDNAIKYNNENGKVEITVRNTEQYAVFSVTDTGIGIPPSDRERIFERFYRVDKSHSREIGGTGLGLSIVKHGAAFHNAKITLDSQPGSGTSISLLFPKRRGGRQCENLTRS
ncbi:MAG: PAS domain-containing protein [Oscillospiraceae bacterium]|nr:PAS domain-containing protein [Oscillospiraceae bacterium]